MCDARAYLDQACVVGSSAATHRFAIPVHLAVSVALLVVGPSLTDRVLIRCLRFPRPALGYPLGVSGRESVEACESILVCRFALSITRRGQASLGCSG